MRARDDEDRVDEVGRVEQYRRPDRGGQVALSQDDQGGPPRR